MRISFESPKRIKGFWGIMFALVYFSYALIQFSARSETAIESRKDYCGTVADLTTRWRKNYDSIYVEVQLNNSQVIERFNITRWENVHHKISTSIGSPICISALLINEMNFKFHVFQITLNDKDILDLKATKKMYFEPEVAILNTVGFIIALFFLLKGGTKFNRKN